MGSSGTGTGTPISGGVGAATSSALPLPWTHLSLGRYAKIMGINPAHFSRAHAPSVTPARFPIATCSNVWPRFSWQNNDQVSHEELAFAIQSAEQDLTDLVGHFLSPDWVEQEVHMLPKEFDRQYYSNGLDVKGALKLVNTNHSKVIDGGIRATTLIGNATVAGGSLIYSDEDGDGVEELATITLATTATVAGEIKVYFDGHAAEREWEVRPIKTRTISGGVVTIRIDAWFLIDPELLSDYPTGDFRAIDISTTANYVTSVNVYREYNDNTQNSADFVWQSVEYPVNCTAFTPNASLTTTQDGVMLAVDAVLGLVRPIPATYVAADAVWRTDAWTECGVAPDYTRLYYYSGEYSEAFLRGISTDPLSDWWAQTIAWIATARLTRPLCGCESASDLAEKMAEDLSLSDNGRAHFTPVALIRNPLGSKRGEVMAWRRISKLVRQKRASFAVI